MDMLIFFQGFDLIPDVVDHAPRDLLIVEYRNERRIEIGEDISPREVRDQPEVLWNAEEDALYLLVMLDPDVPSRHNPKLRCWIHWFVANIPGPDLCCGEVLTEYMGAAPTPESGMHRYVFLLFKQDGLMDFSECTKVPRGALHGRASFSIKKFTRKFKMGAPVAGNFFNSSFESCLPRVICEPDKPEKKKKNKKAVLQKKASLIKSSSQECLSPCETRMRREAMDRQIARELAQAKRESARSSMSSTRSCSRTSGSGSSRKSISMSK